MSINHVCDFMESVVNELSSEYKVYMNPDFKKGIWVELINIKNLSTKHIASYFVKFEVRAFIAYDPVDTGINNHKAGFGTLEIVENKLRTENLSSNLKAHKILGIKNTSISLDRCEGIKSFRLNMEYQSVIRKSLVY